MKNEIIIKIFYVFAIVSYITYLATQKSGFMFCGSIFLIAGSILLIFKNKKTR